MSKTVSNEKTATMAATALAQLSEALAKGDSDALGAFLAFASRFHRYSFRNQILILVQCPDATFVAGFQKWREMGRFVKKGEKGIAILVPIIYKKKGDDAESDLKSEQPAEKEETLVGFTTGYVFDVAQTDGEPIPDLHQPAGDPQHHLQRLRRLTLSKGITLNYVKSLGGAKGVSKGGAVAVLDNLPPAEDFLVLCHELAHELLHRDERRSLTNRQIRELEAESVAFAVGTAIGLQCPSSFDYIRLYRGDEKMLAESLTHIQKISSEILSEIL